MCFGQDNTMKQLLETMCGGDFLSKNPEEAMDFLNYVVETSKAWDEPNLREAEKMRPVTHQRGGIYALFDDMEMKEKLSTLTRQLEELEMRNQHEVQAIAETPVLLQPCFNCQSTSHQGEHCPIAPSVRDLMMEHANVVGQNKPSTNVPYGNTYNPNWGNHPNLSWKPKPSPYVPPSAHQQQQQHTGSTSQQKQLQSSSFVEQAIMNLRKVVGNVENQAYVASCMCMFLSIFRILFSFFNFPELMKFIVIITVIIIFDLESF